MTKFQVVTFLLNTTEGSRFDAAHPDDEFVVAASRNLADGTVDEMLGQAWIVGNKIEADASGQDYPETFRSLSVADVVLFADGTAFAVEPFGWQQLYNFPCQLNGNRVEIGGSGLTEREKALVDAFAASGLDAIALPESLMEPIRAMQAVYRAMRVHL